MNASTLNAEPSPWPRALLLAFCMFLLVGSRAMLVTMQPLVSLGSRMRGHGESPVAYLYAPIAMVVLPPALVFVYGQLSTRCNRARLTSVLATGYVAVLVMTYAMAESGIDSGHGFDVWIRYTNLLIVHLWAITADIFSSSFAGKRVLGVIASGATLAALAYSIVSYPFVKQLVENPRLLLLGVCATVLLASVLAGRSSARSPVASTLPPGERSGFGLLRHDSHVRRVASLVAASCCVSWLLEQLVPQTPIDPWSAGGRTPMLALLLIVQIGVLPLVLPRMSVRWTLLVAPALALVAVGLLLSLPVAQSTSPVLIADSIRSAWDTVAIVALFLSASRNAKYDGQVTTFLVATVIGRGCGAIITGLLMIIGASPLWLTLAPLVPVAVWVWLALGTVRHMKDPAPVQ